MIVLPPTQFPTRTGGYQLFSDHQATSRYYLQADAPQVRRLALQEISTECYYFICELAFSPSQEVLKTVQDSLPGQMIVPMPWTSTSVKLWGMRQDHPYLLSTGTNSGLGDQRSIHSATLDWVPDDIWLTTELSCPAQTHARWVRCAWVDAPELLKTLPSRFQQAVTQSQKTASLPTFGQVAISLLKDLRQQQYLVLDAQGKGADILEEQGLWAMAEELLSRMYGDQLTAIDAIQIPPQFQPGLEMLNTDQPLPLPTMTGHRLTFRYPVIFQLKPTVH